MPTGSVFGLTLHPSRGDERLFHAGPMEPGVHLRWAFRNDMGFPPGGFRLWRRPYVGGGEFGWYLDAPPEDSWEHVGDVDLPTRLGRAFPSPDAERDAAVEEAVDRLPGGDRDLSSYEAGALSLVEVLQKLTRRGPLHDLPMHLRRLRGNGAAPVLDLSALDLVLMATVDPYLARMVGLYYVDRALSFGSYPWRPADYAVEGFWGSTPWPFRRIGVDDAVPTRLVTGDFFLGPLRATTSRRVGLTLPPDVGGEGGLALSVTGAGTLPLHLHFPVEVREVELAVVRQSGSPDWTVDAISKDGALVPTEVTEGTRSVRITTASPYSSPAPGFRRIALYDHREQRNHESSWLLWQVAYREFLGTIGDRRAEIQWPRDEGEVVLDPDRSLPAPSVDALDVGSRPPTLDEEGEVPPMPTVSVNARVPDTGRREPAPVRIEVRRAEERRGGSPPGGRARRGGVEGPLGISVPRVADLDILAPPSTPDGLSLLPLYRLLTTRDGIPAPVLLAGALSENGGAPGGAVEEDRPAPPDYVDVGVPDGTYRYQIRGVDLFGRVSSWSPERTVEVVDRDPPPPPSGVEARYLPLTGELVSDAEDVDAAEDGRPRFRLRTRLDGDPALLARDDGRVPALVRYDLHLHATRDGIDLEGALTIEEARLEGRTLVTVVRRPPFLPLRPRSGDRVRLRFDQRLEVSWTRSGRHRLFFPDTREFRAYVEEGPVGSVVGRVRPDGVSPDEETGTFTVETNVRLPGVRTRMVAGVTHRWTETTWDPGADGPPVFLAAIQGYRGSDPATVRVRSLRRGRAEVRVEEETSSDPETRHVEEVVGVGVFSAGPVRDLTGRRIGVAGRARIDQPARNRWHRLSLDEAEAVPDPVVLAQLGSFEGTQPAHVRIRDVGPRGFDLRIEEWAYLDGRHVEETVSWVVLEKGTHPVGDGSVMEVGTAEADHRWTSVDLVAPFSASPTVFSTVQTFDGSHPVVTRHRGVGTTSFDLRLQEEEGLDARHVTEDVGFAVVGPIEEVGLAADEEAGVPGRPCQVGDSVYEIMSTDESRGLLTLELRYAARPVVEPGAGDEIRIELPGGPGVGRDLSDPASWTDRIAFTPVEDTERVSGRVDSTSPVDPSELEALREAGLRVPAGDPPLVRARFESGGWDPSGAEPTGFVPGALVARDASLPETPWRAFDVLWLQRVDASRADLLLRAPVEAEADAPSVPAAGPARYVPGSRRRIRVEARPSFRAGAGTAELLVGVSAADDQRKTEDPRGFSGRHGNEGAVGPEVTVVAVDRSRPRPPPVPAADIGRADVEGQARATVRWDVRPDTPAGTRYRLYRTTDDALFSWDVRQRRLRRGPYAPEVAADPRGVVTRDSDSPAGSYPADPEFEAWLGARFPDRVGDWTSSLFEGDPDGSPAEREAWEAATPVWQAWADRFYPTLEDFEVQALGGIPGSEGAFALVTDTPVEPGPGADEVVHEDRVGGRVENRYLYRVEALAPSLQSAETWSGASHPVAPRPSRRPPRPVPTGVRADDAGVVLRWTLPGVARMASYRVYRASSAEELDDLRWFEEGDDTRLIRTIPDPRLRSERRASQDVVGLPPWLGVDEPGAAAVLGVYTLRHFDRTRWPPEDQPRALDLRGDGDETALEIEPGGELSIPLKAVGMRTAVVAVIRDGAGALHIVDRIEPPTPLRVRQGTVTLPRRLRVDDVLGVYRAGDFDWSRSSPEDQPSRADALRADVELRVEGGRAVVDGVSLPEDETVVVVVLEADGAIRVVDREEDAPTGRYVDEELPGTADRFYRLVAVDVHGLRSEPSKLVRARPLEVTPPEPPVAELKRTSLSDAEDRIRLAVDGGRADLEISVEWRSLDANVWQPARSWTPTREDGTLVVDLTVASWEKWELRVWSRTPSGLLCSRPPIHTTLERTEESS